MFAKQYLQKTHEIVFDALINIVVTQEKASGFAQRLDPAQAVLNIVYTALRAPPGVTQIRPPKFTFFKQNLLQSYESKRDEKGRKLDPDEQIRAPTGAVGLAVALFDFEPDEDFRDEAL